MKTIAAWLLALATLGAQSSLEFLNHRHPVLDAHNCYPYQGQWADRLDRALGTGFPIAIEQDVAWRTDSAGGRGTAVVSHEAKPIGSEPTLRDYFFEHVRPVVEYALAEEDQANWPLIVLHFDFKSNEPLLLQGVWDLLGEYESWITTAVKTSNPRDLSPFQTRPILVLTEDSDAQEDIFFKRVPVGAKLRLFGSAHTAKFFGNSDPERAHSAATLPPEELLTELPTNYRRWWNNSWSEVEEGGQANAGDWSAADVLRLRSLVDHAHRLGYWIRFYTLDGFFPENERGWDANYNFGSPESVRKRWDAAIAAGVDLIATDQYEDLGTEIKLSRIWRSH